MQFADVITSLQRHWRVSVAILVLTVGGVGVFLITRNETREPDRWEQTVQILVPVRDKDGNPPAGVPPNLLQGQAQVALSQETTSAALKKAGLGEDARGRVTFGFVQLPPSPDTGARGDIITLSASSTDRAEAIALADAYADAYIASRGGTVAAGNTSSTRGSKDALTRFNARLQAIKQELQATNPALVPLIDTTATGTATATGATAARDTQPALTLPEGTSLDAGLLVYEGRTLVQRMNEARQTYGEESADAISPNSFANIVERPYPAQTTPPLPSPTIPVAVALALGLLLAIAVPVLIDRLDHSIRNARTAGNALSAPVLSTIPAMSPLDPSALAEPGTPRDAAYRALAATSVATDQLPRAIVVTSPVGKMQDIVAANFAAALAGLGLRVALVATNARQDWFDDASDAPPAPTLPDLLALAGAGRLNGQVNQSLLPTQLENLAILTPGHIEADALLDGLPTVLQALADANVDVTVIAGPSLLEDPTATILAWSTRSVLWVVEAGEVTEQEAREAASRLALAGATPFGVALVDAED